MPKQHWLKEFMELKLGNLPAQAFTDKFNKACPYILLVGSFKLEIIKFCTSRLSTML